MHGGRRARHEHCCVFLCALPVCSPSLPTRSSQWSPRLMKLHRSATKLKALPTYAAATPLHTHPESWCLITPQTAADKEIRLRWRARKREKEKNWRRKNSWNMDKSEGMEKIRWKCGVGGWGRQKRILTPTCRTWVQTQALSWHWVSRWYQEERESHSWTPPHLHGHPRGSAVQSLPINLQVCSVLCYGRTKIRRRQWLPKAVCYIIRQRGQGGRDKSDRETGERLSDRQHHCVFDGSDWWTFKEVKYGAGLSRPVWHSESR